ncbi:DUF4139 domain-containing protein [Streptomyces sp. NPDC048623]|uniref:DUF4139 domain-containing protein n=1 Tax=Streptomyces sp. NPDC048623 TaxID=3155761 RepID=UPI00341A1519
MGTEHAWVSVLDGVVVYAQGALCTRVARGAVPAGGRVRVTGLPRVADPASLRARVVDGSGVRVTEARVEVAAVPVADGGGDALRREAERLREARDAAWARRERQLTLVKEVTALRPVVPQRKRDEPYRPAPVEAWLELTEFVDERLTRLHARLAELDEELRDLDHEAELLDGRMARASSDTPGVHVETTVSALLTLDGPVGQEVGLEVEYGVPGAVWAPSYRLDARQGDGSGRLVLRASVAQRTGEDWTGVRVAFATADLRRRTDLPRLSSIRIGRSRPVPAPAGWREPPAGLGDLFSGYDATGPAPAPRRPSGRPLAVGAAAGGWESMPVAGGLTPPVPPPPPAPAVMPPPPAPGGPQAPGGAYGAPPPPMARAAAPTRGRGAPPSPAPAPPSVQPVVEPEPGPPRPSGAELDYAALVLSGPGEPAARRGRLFPAAAASDPVAAEYRQRAEKVALLPLPGHAVRPRRSAGSFDHRYDAAARVDIPSDGTWHTVTVGEITVGLRTEYLCVPSVEQTVYATLVLSNTSGQALLAGGMEVTGGGGQMVTAALPTLAPGGERRVGLGPAEGIRVSRRTQLHESTAGLRGGTIVLDHRVRVELANTLARPVTVEVQERVPVTSEADVKIQERADWTEPAGRDGDASGAGPEPETLAPGTRVWRVDLPAGATTALDGGYEIRIPAGKTLAGGDRRS